jgi:NADH dehydrogenase [ubiquinone] 1 alpha subcomplex assembly factor 5
MFSLHTIRASFPRRYIAASSVRTYASQTPGNPMLEVFNRKTKQLQKDRAAQNVEESRKVDYLKDEVAMRLCERLLVRTPT